MIATVKTTQGATITYSFVLVNVVIMIVLLVYTDLYVKILKTGRRHHENSRASNPQEAAAGTDLSASEILNCYAAGFAAMVMGALSYFMLLTL